MLQKQTICGIDITSAGKDEVLEYILEKLKIKSAKLKVYTPNPEIIVYAHHHPEYKEIMNKAEIAIPDGIGVIVAGKLSGKNIKERITGIDLMLDLCDLASEKAIRIGLLGGEVGIAEKAAECLKSKYPGLKVVFAAEEWPEESMKYKVSSIKYKTQDEKILNTKYLIPNTGIDLLFVAFGHPKQEEWISINLNQLPIKVAIGVGGAFDYISGNVPRAPKVIRYIGMEWLFRLMVQPWRWRRQLAILEFARLVIKEVL